MKRFLNILTMKELKNNKELSLKEKCEKLAVDQYGEAELKKLSMKHKGLFYIPCMYDGEIKAYGIFRAITRFDIKTQLDITTMNGSTFDGMEGFAEDLLVGGTDDLMQDPLLFTSVVLGLQRELNKYQTEIVKR